MNKILPIILVVVLSGCATRTPHGNMVTQCMFDGKTCHGKDYQCCVIGNDESATIYVYEHDFPVYITVPDLYEYHLKKHCSKYNKSALITYFGHDNKPFLDSSYAGTPFKVIRFNCKKDSSITKLGIVNHELWIK